MLLIAVGLAMDAFAVSVGKGLTIQGQCKKACIVTGLYFGGFQLIMPLLGFLYGESFIHYIAPISRALSFILLVLIGLNMLREALKENSETNPASIAPTVMIPAAIATSIDAFAVGVTFAALQVNMMAAVLLIGVAAAHDEIVLPGAGAGVDLQQRPRRVRDLQGRQCRRPVVSFMSARQRS